VQLQDATGNVYTYAELGSIPSTYPVPKPVSVSARQIASELSKPLTSPAPSSPATAGSQGSAPTVTVAKATQEAKSSAAPTLASISDKSSKSSKSSNSSSSSSSSPSAGGGDVQTAIPTPMVKERLFANPHRSGSYAAGGMLQIKNAAPADLELQNYFSDTLHLGKNEYTLQPLKAGAKVVAGTILGRLGAGTPQLASHLQFMVRPAGKNAPYIDRSRSRRLEAARGDRRVTAPPGSTRSSASTRRTRRSGRSC